MLAVPYVLGAGRADNCFRMLIVGSLNSLEFEISPAFKEYLSFLVCGLSFAEESIYSGETQSQPWLCKQGHMSAVSSKLTSCMGATAARADKFAVV